MLEVKGVGNVVSLGNNVEIVGRIDGNDNNIIIGDSRGQSKIKLFISGNRNLINIDIPFYIKGATIRVGNHVHAHSTVLRIGANVSIEQGAEFFIYNSGNICEIGADCLFSNSLVIRCGESPHLLFDRDSGEYLDISEGVFIGNHVWIGEGVYVTKRTTIPDESVVAARSVVTKRFEEPNCVFAGNPAKVVRRGVQWIRNHGAIERGSKYEASYLRQRKLYE